MMTRRSAVLLGVAACCAQACWLPTDRYRCTTDADCAPLPGGSCDTAAGECVSTTRPGNSTTSSSGGSSGAASSGGKLSSSAAAGSSGGGGSSVGASSSAAPVDLPPVINDVAPLDVAAGGMASVTLSATDPEGLAVSFHVVEQGAQGVAAVDAAGLFTYTADAAAVGEDTVLVDATDPGMNRSRAVQVRVRVTYAAGAADRVWTGAVSVDWSTAGNWSGDTLPVATDRVLIPAVTQLPALNGNASVGSLVVEAGARLTVASGRTLNVYGDVLAFGPVDGDGVVAMGGVTGLGRVLGMLPQLAVSQPVRVAGPTSVASLQVASSASDLRVGPLRLEVRGDLLAVSQGLISMEHGAGVLQVLGTARFNGRSLDGRMNAGELRLAGDLESGFGFVATGTHRTVFAGSSLHVVVGDLNGHSEVRHATVEGGGTVLLQNGMVVSGTLELPAGATWDGAGVYLRAGQVVSEPTSTMELVHLQVEGPGALDRADGALTCPWVTYAGTSQRVRADFVYTDLEVTGSAVLPADSVVSRDLLLAADARLELQAQVDVGGDTRTRDTASLIMRVPTARLRVVGDLDLDGDQALGEMTDGVTAVQGNVIATSNAFKPGGVHTLRLEGASGQSVELLPPTNVQHLVLATAQTVNLVRDVPVDGDLSLVTGAALTTDTGVVLQLRGDFVVPAGASARLDTLDLRGADGTAHVEGLLQVLSLLVQGDGVILRETGAGSSYGATQITGRGTTTTGPLAWASLATLDQGELALGANLVVSGECDLAGSTLDVGGHHLRCGTLRMRSQAELFMHAGDVVRVEGSAIFQGEVNAASLSGGELHVAGDFTAANARSFKASGTHEVVLDGAVAQALLFQQGDTHFRDLRVAPGAQVHVASGYGVTVNGTLYVEGTLTLDPGADISVGALEVAAGGTLTTLAGTFQFSGAAPGCVISGTSDVACP